MKVVSGISKVNWMMSIKAAQQFEGGKGEEYLLDSKDCSLLYRRSID